MRTGYGEPTMIPKGMIDVSRAEEILDWKPRTSPSEGIKTTVDWYKEYENSVVWLSVQNLLINLLPVNLELVFNLTN
jgi:hypothetical protein